MTPIPGRCARSRLECPIPIASRCFAFYYLLQCLVGISVSKSTVQKCCMAAIASVLGFITVFAVPVG